MGKSIKEFLGLNAFYKREDGTVMTHKEIFTAIVNLVGLDTCIQYIPATKEEIQTALDTDEHLNNISHKKWCDKHESFKHILIRKGINILSISDTVCTLKQASRMWAEQV